MISTTICIYIIIVSVICLLSIVGRTLYKCHKSAGESIELLEQNIDVQIF